MKNKIFQAMLEKIINITVVICPVAAGFVFFPDEKIAFKLLGGSALGGFALMVIATTSVSIRYSINESTSGRWFWSTWKTFPPSRLEKLSLFYGLALVVTSTCVGLMID